MTPLEDKCVHEWSDWVDLNKIVDYARQERNCILCGKRQQQYRDIPNVPPSEPAELDLTPITLDMSKIIQGTARRTTLLNALAKEESDV